MEQPDEEAASAPKGPAGGPISERRLHGRLACELLLNGRAGTKRAPVRALDVSLSGARVVLPEELAQVREIVLSGKGVRSSSTVRAQVVWVQTGGDGEVTAGLHFLEDPSALEATWAHLHLRRHGNGLVPRPKRQQAQACSRMVSLQTSNKKVPTQAELVRLSPAAAQVDIPSPLHLGSSFWIDIPYDNKHKHLHVMTQVVYQQKRGHAWRVSLQFQVPDEARDHLVLHQILKELKDEGSGAGEPMVWI